jgi:exosortase/archaeosortase family protein
MLGHKTRLKRLIHLGIDDSHGRIVLVGLTMGLLYLPFWLKEVAVAAARGSTAVLILFFVGIAAFNLLRDRDQLKKIVVSEDDRLLGHMLVMGGAALFVFCRFALWPQAILWAVVLVGIAISSWGLAFFRLQPVTTMLMLLSVYPKLGVAGRLLWKTFTPPQFLERLMAWSGGIALKLMGYDAVSQGPYLAIPPDGSVFVDWGCNGFSMAANLAAASLVLGLFLKQGGRSIIVMMIVGAFLALVSNVPRIVLLTLAAIYWGEKWFEFWHGAIGGQIFSGLMFTAYYYLIMWIVKRPNSSKRNLAPGICAIEEKQQVK